MISLICLGVDIGRSELVLNKKKKNRGRGIPDLAVWRGSERGTREAVGGGDERKGE